MVITGLTRNQLGSNPPRVRISPSPPKKQNAKAFCFYLGEIRSRPLRKSSCGRFLGRSVDETFPQNVNTRFEIEVFYFMMSRRLRQKTERFCVLFLFRRDSKPTVKKIVLWTIFREERGN